MKDGVFQIGNFFGVQSNNVWWKYVYETPGLIPERVLKVEPELCNWFAPRCNWFAPSEKLAITLKKQGPVEIGHYIFNVCTINRPPEFVYVDRESAHAATL